MKAVPAFHELCRVDELRPIFSYVKVTREKIVATDAHLMGWCETSDVFDFDDVIRHIPEDGMLVHMEDWKKIVAADAIAWKVEGSILKAIYSKKRDALIEVESEKDVDKYPNWEAIVPTGETVEIGRIGVNPDVLFRFSKFLKPVVSNPGVEMDFTGVTRAIRLSPIDRGCNVRGIIMPLMLQ